MKKSIKTLLSVLFAGALLFNAVPVGATETTVAPTEAATVTDDAATTTDDAATTGAVTYSGEYGAYMGIQTNTTLWIFRNAYDDATYGFGTPEFSQLSSVNAGASTAYPGTFTDAVVDGDGTYTVTLENPDFQSEERLSLLFVSTNIPLSDSIKVTDVKVKFDGSTKYTFDEAVLDKESKEFVKILCQNDWNNDVKDLFAYPWPFAKAEITFTISGMGYESQQQAEPTIAPTTAPTSTDDTTVTDTPDDASSTDKDDDSSNTGLIIGIIAAVAVCAVIIIVLVSRKKK